MGSRAAVACVTGTAGSPSVPCMSMPPTLRGLRMLAACIVILVACSSATGGVSAGRTAEAETGKARGVVQVRAGGIWFATPSGRLRASRYRDDVYRLFEGREVEFETLRDENESRPRRFLPGRVELVEPDREDLFLAVGPPEPICGELRTTSPPPGTMRRGQPYQRVHLTDGEHWFNMRVGPVPDGAYRATMRRLEVNESFAPAVPMGMAIPFPRPVWLSDLTPVTSCRSGVPRDGARAVRPRAASGG